MSQQIQLSRLGLCATALILAPVLFELAGIAAADVSSQPTVGGSKVVDPGPRAGPAGAGGPLPGLSDDEKALFDAAKVIFMEVDFFFSSRRRHTRLHGDWSSDECSSD